MYKVRGHKGLNPSRIFNFNVSSLCLILLLSLASNLVLVRSLNIDLIEGEVNKPYDLVVVRDNQSAIQYVLSWNDTDFDSDELRLEAELLDKSFRSEECPLLVTFSQGKHISSWDLPHDYQPVNSDRMSFPIHGKTVCVESQKIQRNSTHNGTIQVGVVTATCSTTPIRFRILLTSTKDSLQMRMGEDKLAWISPSTARFYQYSFPQDDPKVKTVIVKLRSDSDLCMTLSVQKPTCPAFDDETNVRHVGFWQTFTRRTGITIERKDFPDGFFIVLVTNYEDDGCTNKDGYSGDDNYQKSRSLMTDIAYANTQGIIQSPKNIAREKLVEFVVKKALSPSEYVWPTMFPLVVYFPIILITFYLYIVFHRSSVERYTTSSEKPEVKLLSCLRSDKYICDRHDEFDGFKREKLEKKSQRYLWLLITVAIFYCIPVFQLIINYLSIVYRTGEQDICYYNNLCSLPLNNIMDFNHIHSNIGYVIFGILFFFFTLMRQRTMEGRRGFFVFETKPMCCSLLETLPRRVEYGTFDQYGLFYSLGFALFMEGFLSASYHICPNKANFQFDTSFMYAMAVLSYVKVYQFRHFLYMNELMAFLLLALVVGCVVFGLFATNLAFNILLSCAHLFLVIGFQFFLLYTSRTSSSSVEDESILDTMYGVACELCWIKGDNKYLIKHHPGKSLFWWTIGWNILLVINSWTLVYGTNFATQVLYILLANLALYVIYYFIMKGIHGEFRGLFSQGLRNPSLQPVIYSGIASVFWLPGLYYFMNPNSTWDLSPAQSREINESCALFQFYDNHDIWHLLSAPALFFSFMVFLTIDDGLLGRHNECIPVF